MFSARQTATQYSRAYAIPADFCRIFENDMNRLYLLSYLLTADHRTAEECLVRGLEDSTRSNRVFRDWASSWARRMIITNAILMMSPSASDGASPGRSSQADSKEAAPISAVVALPVFERFVFVMTVLERYSDRECSLLLGCSREDISTARVRALRHMGDAAERSPLPEIIDRNGLAKSHLAVSA